MLTSYLIVCPLVFLAGFVDAIGGGGGLISLPAYLFAGLPAHAAVATNKFSSSIGTAVSTVRYCKHGHADWGLAVYSIPLAILGAQLGSRLALIVSDEVFKIMLLVMLPIIALYVLLHKNLEPNPDKVISRKKQILAVIVASLTIGLYDGFYGPGTGTFQLLVYTGVCSLPVLKAAGNTKLANLASNLSALFVFLLSGRVNLPLGCAAAVFSIAGHYVGAGAAMKNGTKLVRIIVLSVITLLFVKVLVEAITGSAFLG